MPLKLEKITVKVAMESGGKNLVIIAFLMDLVQCALRVTMKTRLNLCNVKSHKMTVSFVTGLWVTITENSDAYVPAVRLTPLFLIF